MKEVILNDECIHCKTKECHDGEHFCRQAMKDNSFYKNAKLYKGLEVIQRPTYEELEKENERLTVSYETLKLHDEEEIGILKSENAELKADNDARRFAMAMSEKVEKKLREENADLEEQLENERDLPAIAYMQGAEKQKKEDEEEIAKAKDLLKQWLQTSKASGCDNINIVTDTEQFLKDN